ncbi:MAG: hypothetical protein AB7Q00_00165 [Phycisphaerales bacterium]
MAAMRGGKGSAKMATKTKIGTKASGSKSRGPGVTPHTASRLDPSHGVEKARTTRAKKAATKANAAAKPAARKKSKSR